MTVSCQRFYERLVSNGADFFTGVPDSLLKDLNAYIMDNVPPDNHIIAANEGASVALAAGHHLATNRIGVVYMQNSGLGNAVNPITSLIDNDVYGIPVLLLIGWRGEPGKKDEPQHVKQGKITIALLDTLGIPYEILPQSDEEVIRSIEKAFTTMKEKNIPYAFVIKKDTFSKYDLKNSIKTNFQLRREEAIKLVIDSLEERDVVVSTTGMTSREVFEYREKLGQDHSRDFLTVGSMGHASQIALAIALRKRERQIFCLDGDGALIMHMGSLAIIGSKASTNFKHIVINNGSHDSVGGQPTVGYQIDMLGIAKSCGYKAAYTAETVEDIKEKLQIMRRSEGPVLLEIKVNKGHRSDLGRPTTTPKENKLSFMDFLSK